jgi:putative transposase
MPRVKTTSFIVEIPLLTSAADERELSVRIDAARHIQNAVTGECLRILDLMRESRNWQTARKLPGGSPERRDGFRAVIERFDFKSSMADRFAIACKNACWIGDHLTSNETQKAALRAFNAVKEHAFGKRGRTKFKRFASVDSVEGKTNKTGIRWNSEAERLTWNQLSLSAVIDRNDGWLAEALQANTKYCRIVRREIRGRKLWFAQLIQEGVSPRRHDSRIGLVAIDLGPSSIAAVSDHDAILETFCPTVIQPWKDMRRIERAMDRSRRSTNPDNFDAKSRVSKGRKKWIRSQRYQELASKRRERERCLTAERKLQHGSLCTRILAQGSTVNAEKLSYVAFQKMFGRSTKVRGVGSFMATLRRRAKEAGGSVFEFSTRKTALSQFDHTTGDYLKKPLSLRTHVLRDGSGTVQRDLYSAFLARFVGASETLDARQAKDAFPAAKPLLDRAASRSVQSTSRVGFPHPHGRLPVREDRTSKTAKEAIEATDVVAMGSKTQSEGRREIAFRLSRSAVRNPRDLSLGMV